ncbi:hypothetical protein Trydic_g2713 [Trypoxylus dichotomus]
MVYGYCVFCPNNSRDNPTISYFRFPKDETRCKQWQDFTGLEKVKMATAIDCYKRFRLCSMHFEEKMFAGMVKKKLKLYAIPTLAKEHSFEMHSCKVYEPCNEVKVVEEDPLRLDVEPTEIITSKSFHAATHIEKSSASNKEIQSKKRLSTNSLRKSKLRKAIKIQRYNLSKTAGVEESRVKHLTQFLTMCDEFLSPKLAAIVKFHAQIRYKSNSYPVVHKQFDLERLS